MPLIASAAKVAYHEEKLEAYVRGERTFPATLELDLTAECNMRCGDCASSTSVPTDHLDIAFVDRILALLEGQTRGLLLTGGEPTLARTFPETLGLARRRGFVDVVVVTNGTLLCEPPVAAALLEHASAVRISIYDWTLEPATRLPRALRAIEALRARIDREGSALEIGVSALTTHDNAALLARLASEVAQAGAHWLYLHPFCIRWDSGAPERVDQSDVWARVEALQADPPPDGLRVHAFPDRYSSAPLTFTGYHAAYFLLVVGADGMNYLAPEVKYHARNVIADLTNGWRDDFLWSRERLERIASVGSDSYPAMGSRHRGVLYNDLIQARLGGAASVPPGDTFLFPHIL